MPFTFQKPGGAGGDVAVAPTSAAPVMAAAFAVSPQTADLVAQQRATAGTILVELYDYLRANALQHPTLAPAIPALSDAVAQYRAGQDADPFAGARTVYALIQQARAGDPALPPA